MAGVKGDMKDLKAMVRRTMVQVERLSRDLSELKDFLKVNMATKEDISKLSARMDGFSRLLLDSRPLWAVPADALKRHDDRPTKLEKLSS